MSEMFLVWIAILAGAVMCAWRAIRAKGFIESLFWSFITLVLCGVSAWWVFQVT